MIVTPCKKDKGYNPRTVVIQLVHVLATTADGNQRNSLADARVNLPLLLAPLRTKKPNL